MWRCRHWYNFANEAKQLYCRWHKWKGNIVDLVESLEYWYAATIYEQKQQHQQNSLNKTVSDTTYLEAHCCRYSSDAALVNYECSGSVLPLSYYRSAYFLCFHEKDVLGFLSCYYFSLLDSGSLFPFFTFHISCFSSVTEQSCFFFLPPWHSLQQYYYLNHARRHRLRDPRFRGREWGRDHFPYWRLYHSFRKGWQVHGWLVAGKWLYFMLF